MADRSPTSSPGRKVTGKCSAWRWNRQDHTPAERFNRRCFPTWSPDGKYLYFISAQGTANTPISEQSLYRIVMNSAKQELVTNLRELRHDSVGHFISWIGFAPDGSILALRDNTTVDIFSLDWISP